jgi:hypothetical protein
MTIEAGVIEVAGVMVTTAVDTVLNITSAGDWVDNTLKQAVSKYGYIYVNAAGNIELDDQAPDESDISGNTSGILRYNDTGTDTSDRRMIGWFYMNATGAGELNSYEVGNLKDGDVQNSIVHTDSTDDTITDQTFPSTDLTGMEVHFYTSGRGPVKINGHIVFNSGTPRVPNAVINDGANVLTSIGGTYSSGVAADENGIHCMHSEKYAQGGVTFNMEMIVDSSSVTAIDKTLIIEET